MPVVELIRATGRSAAWKDEYRSEQEGGVENVESQVGKVKEWKRSGWLLWEGSLGSRVPGASFRPGVRVESASSQGRELEGHRK